MNSINPPAGGVTLCSCGLDVMTSGRRPARTTLTESYKKHQLRSNYLTESYKKHQLRSNARSDHAVFEPAMQSHGDQ